MTGDTTQENKKQVQVNFGRQAVAYNANCLLADKGNLNTIIKMADISNHDRVLDVATGTGFLASALSDVAKEVIATDITIEMLQQTLKKTQDNTSFSLADVEMLPFSDRAFDVVTCRVALHHFTRPRNAFSEICRVSKRNGRVVIMDIISSEDEARSEYHNRMERLRDNSHIKQYSLSELERMLEDNGLQIDRTEIWNYSWAMEEWLAIANPDVEPANQVRRLMAESIEGDKSGLNVRIDDGEVYFTYTAAILAAHVRGRHKMLT